MIIPRFIIILGFFVFIVSCGSGSEPDSAPKSEQSANVAAPEAIAATEVIDEPIQSSALATPSDLAEVSTTNNTIEPAKSAPEPIASSTIPTVETDPLLVFEPDPIPTVEPEPTPIVEPDLIATAEPSPTPTVAPDQIPAVEPDPTPIVEPDPPPTIEPDSAPAVEPDLESGQTPVSTATPMQGDFAFNLIALGLLDGDSTGWEQSRDVDFDSAGNVYVVGGTSSANFPVTAGAYDVSYNTGGSEKGLQGDTDAFVAKIDPAGNILWLTFLGGPNYDRAYAVKVDQQNNVYVAGRAGNGFPTTTGALQTVFGGDSRGGSTYGNQDGFITKLSSDGSSVIWSTYFGASGPGFIRDIDIDASDRVHIAATAINGDMSAFVTSNAAQSSRRGDFDSFYARLSADGTTIEYGTYLGGNDNGGYYSGNPAVRAMPDGTAYFMSYDTGAGAPTTSNAYQPKIAGGYDFLIAKFTPQGDMAFCTYLGGSGLEVMDTHSLAITPSGNPVIVGYSDSGDYPVTNGFDNNNLNGDIAMSVLSADGRSLLASRLLGGNGIDSAEGVDVDAQGNIYITGNTRSADLPVTQNAMVPNYIGERSGLMAVLTEDLAVVRYLSYDGIPSQYAGRSTAVGPDGQWAFVGDAWRIDPFPGTSGQDININGLHGAFFGILDPLR